jgi:hypothetical protein
LFGLCSSVRDAVAPRHRAFLRFVAAYPFTLIPLLPLYVLAALFVTIAIMLGAGLLADAARPGWTDENFDLLFFCGLAAFTFLLSAFLLHYCYLSYRSFVSAHSAKRSADHIFRIVQLLGATVVFFAIVHYYVALLSDEPAYKGIAVPEPASGWFGWEHKLLTPPPLSVLVDCLYFSVVTSATVGYGDAHPVSMLAKIVTMLQIFFSFVLVVVSLGWAISHGRDEDAGGGRV